MANGDHQTSKVLQSREIKSPPVLLTMSRYWLSLASSSAAAATPALETAEEITAD